MHRGRSLSTLSSLFLPPILLWHEVSAKGFENDLLFCAGVNALMLLHDQDVDVQIAVAPEAAMRYDDVAGLLMHNMARERVLAGEEYEKWSSFMYPLEGYDEALADGSMYYMVRVDGVVTEYTGSAAQRAARETFGDVQASVAVRVIDRRDGSLVAQKAF